MSMYGRFEFALPLTKAYKSGDGKMHVVGTASDTLPDLHDDRMSEKAVESMAKQATENALPLLDNHRATFGFGKTVEGQVAKKAKARELVIDFELDAKYPQSLDLFHEVLAGKSAKQLSIGGMLNLENPNAVRFEEDKKTGRLIRVIDDIVLEHIAATRPKQAANERTAFLQAIVKDVLGEPYFPVYEPRSGSVTRRRPRPYAGRERGPSSRAAGKGPSFGGFVPSAVPLSSRSGATSGRSRRFRGPSRSRFSASGSSSRARRSRTFSLCSGPWPPASWLPGPRPGRSPSPGGLLGGEALVPEAKEAYRAALAPYREACHKAGVACEYEGGRSANVSDLPAAPRYPSFRLSHLRP